MPPRSILVVKPSSLGDIVHTLPAVTLVRRAWPDAKLRWVVNTEWTPLLEGNPDIDEIVPFPRRELSGSFFKQLRWLHATGAAFRSDLILDFQGLLRSALIGRFCRGGTLVGRGDAREGARFFYDQRVPMGKNDHAVDRYLKLVAALGIDTTGPLTWNLPQGTRPAGFILEEPFVVLHPFARGSGKSLSTNEIAEFTKAMPLPVIIVGRSDVPIKPVGKLLNLLNRTTIPELIWLIRQAHFVVSVDSGPMHIAAALTPNLLSIHTWSDPALVGPYRPEAWVWKDRTLFQMRELRTTPPHAGKPTAAPDIASVAAHVSGLIAK